MISYGGSISAFRRAGKISMFNRSYYEDVLVVKVHELNKTYKWQSA